MIIGISVGAAVLLLVLICMIWCGRYRCRQKRRGPAPPSKGREYTDKALGEGAFEEGYRIQETADGKTGILGSSHDLGPTTYYLRKPGESGFKQGTLEEARALRLPNGDE